MADMDDIQLEIEDVVEEEKAATKEEVDRLKEQTKKTLQKIKENAKEEDPKFSSTMTLRTILGGDFLTAQMVRHHIGIIVLVVVFAIVYVAFRYQCQQDMIAIDKMEKELLDAKYKALSSSSTLTEKCRESHVLEALKNNKDSVLHIADQPPYIINVPE
jgi:glucan-binding YG repeat protein